MSTDQTSSDSLNLKLRFRRFFYAEEVPYGMAIVRILMPLVLLVPMLPRWPIAREIFSADGAPAPLWFNYGWPNLLPLLPGGVIVALHTLLIFFLIASALGWKTRFSLAGATLLFVYINLCDSVSTITKYSVIASHALLLLTLSNCGAIWSIDAWLKNRRKAHGPHPPKAHGLHPVGLADELPRAAVWPQRLLQLMIGIVYFGAAITKMHTPAFFSGEQLQTWLLSNVNYQNVLGEYLSLFPAALVFFAYIAIVWEVLFVFLVWRGWGRITMLGLGAAFHLMTTLLLGLYVFPMVCISIYFAFIDERSARRFGLWFRNWQSRWGLGRSHQRVSGGLPEAPVSAPHVATPAALRIPSPVVYGLVMLGVGVIGLEIEHQLDPYGKRRPEGPYTLTELDPDVVAEMLAPTKPMRLSDMFDTFAVGTDLIGGLLLDRRDEFRQGETVVTQVGFNMPHHDMWLECNLHDAGGNELDRVGQVVSREMFRANFYYNLSDVLEPGEYEFVLKSGGHEVTRRRIKLLPRRKSPVAN